MQHVTSFNRDPNHTIKNPSEHFITSIISPKFYKEDHPFTNNGVFGQKNIANTREFQYSTID